MKEERDYTVYRINDDLSRSYLRTFETWEEAMDWAEEKNDKSDKPYHIRINYVEN